MVRPTKAEIDLAAIRHNLSAIRHKVSPSGIMAVVKADAYGHGAVEVARLAVEAGANYLAVALVEEACELRLNGISSPILIFGGELQDQIDELLQIDADITVYSLELAKLFSEKAFSSGRRVSVHVKVDTGMGRVGVPWTQAARFVIECKTLPGLDVKGLYTHFATSDEKDKEFANEQLSNFRSVIATLESKRIRLPLVHAANSGAILDMPDAYFDMVRPGIMMYGYYPSNETSESVPLKPAMKFKSKIIHLKEVDAHTSISYGRTYYTASRTQIATIPVGYADGYNRLLSNKAYVTINSHAYPVVGRVCMDQTLVDVGINFSGKIGDDVILFGPKSEGNEFTVNDICAMINTIPYEVCCWVSKRVPRIYRK
ncbi:alanine racemase [candidate division KSB1 bacterium]|nr:alanine racemase [candidate division KSB1 bacterium]